MARKQGAFTIEQMKSLRRHPHDDRPFMNPFNYDHARMGVEIGKNVTVMYHNHGINQEIVIVDNKTGDRIKVIINSTKEKNYNAQTHSHR